jgi:hypothetical protein
MIIKAARARELAGLNYWQMPFASAICREEFSGLTLEKWIKAREARGLDGQCGQPPMATKRRPT